MNEGEYLVAWYPGRWANRWALYRRGTWRSPHELLFLTFLDCWREIADCVASDIPLTIWTGPLPLPVASTGGW